MIHPFDYLPSEEKKVRLKQTDVAVVNASFSFLFMRFSVLMYNLLVLSLLLSLNF